jgi:hypothetical protein
VVQTDIQLLLLAGLEADKGAVSDTGMGKQGLLEKGKAFSGEIFFLFSSVSRLMRKISPQRTPEEREL